MMKVIGSAEIAMNRQCRNIIVIPSKVDVRTFTEYHEVVLTPREYIPGGAV